MQRAHAAKAFVEGFTDKPHFAFLERHRGYRLKVAESSTCSANATLAQRAVQEAIADLNLIAAIDNALF